MNTDGIFWLGQSAFRIESGGKVLYIDPYMITDPAKKADIILITHAHFDHCSVGDIQQITKKDSFIVSAESCAGKFENEVKTMRAGDVLDAAGFTVVAVRAYNTDKNFHPKSSGWLGFVVTLPDGRRIYHAGDTDNIPEMKDIKNIDIAFLPVGGTYTMDAEEAASAALVISPKIAVPMHYGSVVGSSADAGQFASLLKGKIKTVIMGSGLDI
ncbi:MAG: MBL fold metallo-hydrolase [Candidatus Omnitrophota bacterium]|nr:MBL fold metallo-hydrolase [bacterium]MBU3930343.1 MBL fold metallo-hydrolase [bacterium]MBU4123762.1 MBL fold metallo-hydrolase [bacterium]